MKVLIVVLALAAIASGVKYNGLRVKFGWSDSLADKEFFFKIPRTIKDAEAAGWKRTERPAGPLPELQMYCTFGRSVCPLYAASGFVAGLQLALPVNQFTTVKPENFVKWTAPAADGEPSKDYWTITQFYVSEESLKKGAGPQEQNGATLQDGGVWVVGPDGKLLKIPTSEDEINATAYTRQSCIPNMGTHYFYKMTPTQKCEDHFPWFVLTNEGKIIGTGLMVFGRLAQQKPRHWFESPNTRRQLADLVMPFAPPCFGEWAMAHGITAMHIYFMDDPWNIRCND